ncbi:hypothetical protein [Actinoplanes sp. NPDC051859]|uniref:hypothetical protein n=1 Tax=Actinoplanes sp. NPDC051859 TaxID=3363909 RepID=UPI0037A82AF5
MPTVETAAVLWMTLLLAVAAAAALLALPRRDRRGPAFALLRRRPAHARSRRRPALAGSRRAARRAVDAEPEVDRYADELARAVEVTAATVQRRRATWERAQQEVDRAWNAYDDADRTARRCTAAAAFPILKQRRTRAEIADRERFLHRTAVEACRRKELSIDQLNEALAHRNGWNPRKHPVAQEAAVRAAVREHRFAAYQTATERERTAWDEMEKAAAALRRLRAEALDARLRVGRDIRPAEARERAGQRGPTEVARPATALPAH